MKEALEKHVQTATQWIEVKGLLCARHYSRLWELKSEKKRLLQLFSNILDQKLIIVRVRIQEWVSWLDSDSVT